MTMVDFSTISPFYDLMTGYSKRLANDFGTIKNLVEKFNIKAALDAGCGTGVHSIILAKLGVDVLGFDASAEMLEMARINAKHEGVKPAFEQEYFETVPEEWWGKYDAVFCLANSLVGVQIARRLDLAMQSFCRALKPGGKAIIQVLNTKWFLNHDERIIRVSSEENFTFVRFFDFDRDITRLNVIAIEHEMGEVKHRFVSSKIMALDQDRLSQAARYGGFSQVEFFSDMILSKPLTNESRDMVVVLTK
jgi:SAM-dependent methyltransferase